MSPGKLPLEKSCAITSVALCGTLAGQIFFGRVGDILGRKTVYGITLAIMMFSALAQSMSFGTSPDAVVGTLCFWRFLLGFGVGGDYPLSATIMSEYSSTMVSVLSHFHSDPPLCVSSSTEPWSLHRSSVCDAGYWNLVRGCCHLHRVCHLCERS